VRSLLLVFEAGDRQANGLLQVGHGLLGVRLQVLPGIVTGWPNLLHLPPGLFLLLSYLVGLFSRPNSHFGFRFLQSGLQLIGLQVPVFDLLLIDVPLTWLFFARPFSSDGDGLLISRDKRHDRAWRKPRDFLGQRTEDETPQACPS